MKKSLLSISSIAIVLVCSVAGYSQQSRVLQSSRASRISIPNESAAPGGHFVGQSASYHSVPMDPLPASISIPGINTLPIQGTWVQQSNGRSLHNIQVDPSNPMNVHAVVTANLDLSASDTATAAGPGFTADTGRRCFYLFSSDGGVHWNNPVLLSSARQGYADMTLMKRGDVWVPIIIAHRYYPGGNGNLYTALYIEKGQPGAGNFSQCLASRINADGTGNLDIIWPVLAINPTNDTIYALASISPTSNGNASDQLQFGKFALTPSKDSAYFLGQNTSQSQWLSKPGDYSGATGDGLTYGGAYRIQVSATGRIGVAWECLASSGGYPTSPDDPTLTIFYSESTDGGATWTADPDVVSAVDPNTDQLLNQFAPTDNFDFWFDGETPKFVLERSIWNFSNAPSITYYPNSAILYYKNMLTGDSTVIAHADTTTTVDNPIPNVMHLPAGSQVHIQGEMINFPAIALTPKSGRLAVVYQTYANGDSALVTDDGSTFDTLAYGSIYYSESQDGGLTWGTPTPWLVNSGTGQKYDYRYPQTSYYNPISSGAPTYHLLTSIDSAAGWVVQNGVTPGFDIINFGHATVTTAPAAVSAVPTASAQIAASPNPFSGSTTISWSSITSGSTVLDVRDALGRECFSIDAHKLGATSNGSYTLNPNLLGLAPGVYFVTVSNGASVATEKVVYLQ